jgi:hypothetical protein
VSEWVIRPARREDKEWVKPLFERDRLLGRFGPSWWYYWSRYRDPEERWDVVDGGQGFVHYRARQDGLVSLYEMAVHPDYRRQLVLKRGNKKNFLWGIWTPSVTGDMLPSMWR